MLELADVVRGHLDDADDLGESYSDRMDDLGEYWDGYMRLVVALAMQTGEGNDETRLKNAMKTWPVERRKEFFAEYTIEEIPEYIRTLSMAVDYDPNA